MNNELTTIMRNWLLDWSYAPRSQQAFEFYAQLRRLCKFEPIEQFEHFNRIHMSDPSLMGRAVLEMLQFDLALSAPYWIPVIEEAGAKTWLIGEGDELLGMRWTGGGTLSFEVFDCYRPPKTYELNEPFELNFPWSTSWKHSVAIKWVALRNPLPADLEVKWCIYAQSQCLYKAKEKHSRRFSASLDIIKARSV